MKIIRAWATTEPTVEELVANGGLPAPKVSTVAPVSATKALAENLQRALGQYATRAEHLQAQIDNATGELADVRKAQEAASAALDALVGEVAQRSLELELGA